MGPGNLSYLLSRAGARRGTKRERTILHGPGARLGHAAAEDLLDLGRIDAAALDQFDLHGTEELSGVEPRQHAVAPADGAAQDELPLHWRHQR